LLSPTGPAIWVEDVYREQENHRDGACYEDNSMDRLAVRHRSRQHGCDDQKIENSPRMQQRKIEEHVRLDSDKHEAESSRSKEPTPGLKVVILPRLNCRRVGGN
jgi:hypothetical protein